MSDTQYFGIYRGKVLNTDDPDKAGKVKVQIYPMFRGISDHTLLPWAVPAYPIFEGSGSGMGYLAVPKIGTLVYCMFEAGDVNQPVYMFEAPSKTLGIPASSATNYPDRKVWRTKNGVQMYIDDKSKTIDLKTPGAIEIKIDDQSGHMNITHPTGAYIVIDELGQVLINGTNITITTHGVTRWQGVGEINIRSRGTVNVTGDTRVHLNPPHTDVPGQIYGEFGFGGLT